MQSYRNPELDLSGAFNQDAGYSGMCWITLDNGNVQIDRIVPAPLQAFVEEVARIVHAENLDDECRFGNAYMRVIEAGDPENHLRWHSDNEAGSVRFSTAIATDDAKVNVGWATGEWAGLKVVDTDWRKSFQPENGAIVMFTTEVHGVLPQPPRHGERTAVFFATLYPTREAADVRNCYNFATTPTVHRALPVLEVDR